MNDPSPPVRLLGLSGSLRRASSNTALLDASATLTPDHVELTVHDGLDSLPHFDPDVEREGRLPPSVSQFRDTVTSADGLVISCPEYAHGVPGTFKNSLDWLVGAEGFAGTPVALFDTAPRASHADRHLREILTTMAAEIVDEASVTVPLQGRGQDADGIASDEEVAREVRDALGAFVDTLA